MGVVTGQGHKGGGQAKTDLTPLPEAAQCRLDQLCASAAAFRAAAKWSKKEASPERSAGLKDQPLPHPRWGLPVGQKAFPAALFAYPDTEKAAPLGLFAVAVDAFLLNGCARRANGRAKSPTVDAFLLNGGA